MTEDQIERKVELLFNRIDHKLMNGEIPQSVYDILAKDIHDWAENQYAKQGGAAAFYVGN